MHGLIANKGFTFPVCQDEDGQIRGLLTGTPPDDTLMAGRHWDVLIEQRTDIRMLDKPDVMSSEMIQRVTMRLEWMSETERGVEPGDIHDMFALHRETAPMDAEMALHRCWCLMVPRDYIPLLRWARMVTFRWLPEIFGQTAFYNSQKTLIR